MQRPRFRPRRERHADRIYSVLNRSEVVHVTPAIVAAEEASDEAPIVAIGLDTNALKLLRQDPILASELVSFIGSSGIKLIVPSQAMQEFWNNHRTFLKGSESLDQDLQRLQSTIKKMTGSTTSDELTARMVDIQLAITAFEKESAEARDPDLYDKSASIWRELETVAVVPSVPRDRFAGLANVRFAAKMPPGFEDHDKFPRHLGDFFVWADFLLGLALALSARPRESVGRVVFFTDDAKQDWLTSSKPHPLLAAECFAVSGQKLEILPTKNLAEMVRA